MQPSRVDNQGGFRRRGALVFAIASATLHAVQLFLLVWLVSNPTDRASRPEAGLKEIRFDDGGNTIHINAGGIELSSGLYSTSIGHGFIEMSWSTPGEGLSSLRFIPGGIFVAQSDRNGEGHRLDLTARDITGYRETSGVIVELYKLEGDRTGVLTVRTANDGRARFPE